MIISLKDSPIGRNIRFLRKLHGLSRREFAEIMDIYVDSVIFIEEEFECIFTDSELHSWCNFFGISEKMLIELDLEMLFQKENPAL